MNSISGTAAYGIARSGSLRFNSPSLRQAAPPREDAVEISPLARELNRDDQAAPLRQAMIERVRAEIAAGTYLTDDKLDGAMDGLLRDLEA